MRSSFIWNGFVLVPVSVPLHDDIVSSAQHIVGEIPHTIHFMVPPSSVTPVDAEKLRRELSSHHDQTRVNYVVSGLRLLSVGFNSQAVF